VTSVKGVIHITPPLKSVNILAALLLASMLTQGAARAAEAPAPDIWTDQKIEAAFHDVLAHGELSDIGFLARTLGLDLEVAQWEQQSRFQKEVIETRAMATRVPSYLRPYGTSYGLTRNTKDGTTRINFNFRIKSCPDLVLWGMNWSQEVKRSEGPSTDAGPYFWEQSIRWQQDADGIVLERVTNSDGLCDFTLTQKKHAALSIPEPPATTPGSGTDLLEQMLDLIVAGDLRDYLTTAHILHTELSTYGELRGRHLYDGGAVPERLIPGTNSGAFIYSANDTGWINMSIFFYVPPRRGPRTVQLTIPVDNISNCISPESLEARLRQRRIHFQKKSDRNLGPYLETFQRGNAFSIGYYVRSSCIEEFNLRQKTDFAHSPP